MTCKQRATTQTAAKRPDLNRIDYLLDLFKRKVRAQPLQINLRELMCVIHQMGAAIPQQYIGMYLPLAVGVMYLPLAVGVMYLPLDVGVMYLSLAVGVLYLPLAVGSFLHLHANEVHIPNNV